LLTQLMDMLLRVDFHRKISPSSGTLSCRVAVRRT
jgi:hypothetical protein